MPSLIWTPEALADVKRLYAFLFEKDVDVAKAVAATILSHAKKLEEFPHMGRPSVDLEPEHRELLIPFASSGYVLLYAQEEQEGESLVVLAVRHQKEAGY